MITIDVSCPARINLFFNVTGYNEQKKLHYLKEINQTIDLYDNLTIFKSPNSLSELSIISSKEVQDYLYNDLLKAYQLFFSYTDIPKENITIIIKKNIPIDSGLGDKGSIIANFIKGLNSLYKTNLSIRELKFISSLVNYEAPFFIEGGYAKITSTGDKITKLSNNPYKNYLIIVPNIKISTEQRFEQLPKHYTPVEYINSILYNDFNKLVPSELLRLRDFLLTYKDLSHSLLGVGKSYFIASEKIIDSSLRKTLKREFPEYLYFNQKNSHQPAIIKNYK